MDRAYLAGRVVGEYHSTHKTRIETVFGREAVCHSGIIHLHHPDIIVRSILRGDRRIETTSNKAHLLITHIDIDKDITHDDIDYLTCIEKVIKARTTNALDNNATFLIKRIGIDILNLFLDNKGEDYFVVEVTLLYKFPQPSIFLHIFSVVA